MERADIASRTGLPRHRLRPYPPQMIERDPCVYIMASGLRGYLYVGVTSDLMRRVYEHRHGIRSGWAKDKGCTRLVWFQMCGDMDTAIAREKQLKNWHRGWKINLVEDTNLHWRDLAVDLGFDALVER